MTDHEALAAAVREIETHAADAGWDQPARLFALVDTATLVAHEPALAQAMGLAADPDRPSLTPVEQELAGDRSLEDLLDEIEWPAGVAGCAAVVERLVLPPSAESDLPGDAGSAVEAAWAHPERQEVRIVAGATRGGTTYCALRMRGHDDAASVLLGPDLVPGLLELLVRTLVEEQS